MTHCSVSTVEKARCQCGEVMYRRVYREKEADASVDERDGLFVKWGVYFLITEDLDLKVFPAARAWNSLRSLTSTKKEFRELAELIYYAKLQN